MADAERAIGEVGSAWAGATVRIFTTIHDTFAYLTVTCPFLGRSAAASTPTPPTVSATPQSPQNSNGRHSRNRHPPSMATLILEGPPTNDQATTSLHDIILNSGGLSPNRGAARQAGGPLLPPPNGLRDTLFICTTEEGRTDTDTTGCTRVRPGRRIRLLCWIHWARYA